MPHEHCIPAAKIKKKRKRLSNQSVEKKGVECLFYKYERAGIRTENGSQVRQRLYTERLVHQFYCCCYFGIQISIESKKRAKHAKWIHSTLCLFLSLCHDWYDILKLFTALDQKNEYRGKIGSKICLAHFSKFPHTHTHTRAHTFGSWHRDMD